MEWIVVLALVALAIYFFRKRGRIGGLGGHKFKCHDCRYNRRTFDDGVMCGFGNKEVFKNRRHIAMCPDWSPKS